MSYILLNCSLHCLFKIVFLFPLFANCYFTFCNERQMQPSNHRPRQKGGARMWSDVRFHRYWTARKRSALALYIRSLRQPKNDAAAQHYSRQNCTFSSARMRCS